MPKIHDANDRDDTVAHAEIFTDINAAKFETDYKLIKYLKNANEEENGSLFIQEDSDFIEEDDHNIHVQENNSDPSDINPSKMRDINGQKESFLYLASMRYHGLSHFLLNQPFTLARFAHNIKEQGYIALLSAGGYGGVHDSEPVFHIARAYLGITKNQFSYPPCITPAKLMGDVQSEFSETLLGRLLPGDLFYSLKWHEAAEGLPADADVEEGKVHVVKDTATNELRFKVKLDNNEVKKGSITATEFARMNEVTSQDSLTLNKNQLFALLQKRKHGKQLEKKTFNAIYWNADGTLNKNSPEVQALFEQKKRTAYAQAEHQHKLAIYEWTKADYEKDADISGKTRIKVDNAIAGFIRSRNKSEAEYTLEDKNAVLAFQYKQIIMAMRKVEHLNYDDELEGVVSAGKAHLLIQNATMAHRIITEKAINNKDEWTFFNQTRIVDKLKFADIPSFPYSLEMDQVNAFISCFISHEINTDEAVIETLAFVKDGRQIDDASFKNKICYPFVETPEIPDYFLTYLIEEKNANGLTSSLKVTIDLEIFYRQYLQNNGDLAFGEHDGGTKFFAQLRGLMSQNIKVESSPENGITLNYFGPISESKLTTPMSSLLLRDDDNKYLKFHKGAGAKTILADTFVSSSYKKEMEKTLKNERSKLKEFEKTAKNNTLDKKKQQQIKETKKKIQGMEKNLQDKQTENAWRAENPPQHLEEGDRLLLPDEMVDGEKETVSGSLKECELALRHLTQMKGDYYQYAGYDGLVNTYSELKQALSTCEIGALLSKMETFCEDCSLMKSTIRREIDRRKSHLPEANANLRKAIEATETAIKTMKAALIVSGTTYSYNEVGELSRLFDILKNDALLRLTYFLPDVNTDIALFMSTKDLMASLEHVRLKAQLLAVEDIPDLIDSLNQIIKQNFLVEESANEVQLENREAVFNKNIASLKALSPQNEFVDNEQLYQDKLRQAYLIIQTAYVQYKAQYDKAMNSFEEMPLFLRNAARNQDIKNALEKEWLDLQTEFNTKICNLKPSLKAWTILGKDLLKKTEVRAWENRNHHVWAHIGRKSGDNIELKQEDRFIFPASPKLKDYEKFFDLTLDDKGEIRNQDALIGPFVNYNRAITSLNQQIDAKKEGESKNRLIEKRMHIIDRFNEVVTNGHSERWGFEKYEPTGDLNWLVKDCKEIAEHKSTTQTVVRGFVGAAVATTTGAAFVGAGVGGGSLLSSFWGFITLALGTGALSGSAGGPLGMLVGALAGAFLAVAAVTAVAAAVGAGYSLYGVFKKPVAQPLVVEPQNDNDPKNSYK